MHSSRMCTGSLGGVLPSPWHCGKADTLFKNNNTPVKTLPWHILKIFSTCMCVCASRNKVGGEGIPLEQICIPLGCLLPVHWPYSLVLPPSPHQGGEIPPRISLCLPNLYRNSGEPVIFPLPLGKVLGGNLDSTCWQKNWRVPGQN